MVVPTGRITVMQWHAVTLSDRGRQRRRNEDAWLARPDLRLFAVADGMGGHAAGDVASQLAIRTLAESFVRPPSARISASTLTERLVAAFLDANHALLEHAAQHRACAGMGTTLTALAPLYATPQCVLVHIGDSRAYRMRAGALTQLTVDHTWVQQQIDLGMLKPDEARHHPWAPVLTRVLGTPQDITPDAALVDVAPGDRFLLCSDGLTGMIEHADLEAMLARKLPLEQHARDLIDTANQRGGHDNITVIVLQAE